MESTSSQDSLNNSLNTSLDDATNVTAIPEIEDDNYTEEELKKAEEFKDQGNKLFQCK